MADHVRTQCRDAAKALLDDLVTTGENCTAGRPGTRTLQESELPHLLIYTNEEELDPGEGSGTRGARRKVHSCQLMVRGVVAGTGDVDKTLDDIDKEVCAALEAAPTLGGLAKDLYLTGVLKEDADAGEQPVWTITLTFTCEYHTREGAPDVALA